MAVLLICLSAIGCGGSSSRSSSGNNGGGNTGGGNSGGSDTSTTVGVVLSQASIFNDNFANADNWDFLNGATGSVSNGVLTVTAPTAEGIAMKIKDTVWAQMGSPSSYFVEMLIKPTSLPTGNKNIGIASNIQNNNTEWYYAGFNSNGRMQAGYSGNLKGYQNSNDGTTLAGESDLVYYKWRYENNNGVINFYSNDLYMGKNTGSDYLGKGLANYTPGQGYTGGFGVYSCGASFEVAAVRVGLITENQTKLVLDTTESSLPRLWSQFVRLINSEGEIKVGDKVDIKVTAFTPTGAADSWTAVSTNTKVLAVSSNSGSSGDTLTITGVGFGKATVVITNGSDSGSRRSITFSVAEASSYVDDAYTNIDNLVYPKIGTTAAYADGEIAIKFDSTPVIADPTGEILICDYNTDATVDSIKISGDSFVISDRGTKEVNVGSQRVRIDGNILYIAPHNNALAYNTKYYVAIPNGVISGTLNGVSFTGFSPSQKTWNFTTKSAPTITNGQTITVDGSQNSTATFRTVQAALDAAKSYNNLVIEIAPGTYRELLTYKKDYNVTLKGTGSAAYGTDVVIEYKNGEKVNSGTAMRPLAYLASSGTITLVNLTFKNAADKASYGQAETIYFDRDTGKLVAKNCSFISRQDTLLTKGYNWFYQCYIEGDTDFIWGYSLVSLYEQCKIKLVSDGSIISHARCQQSHKGYVFLNCDIEAVTGTNYLARDMSGTESNYDNIAFINCKITGAGTLNWDNSFEPTPKGQASALTGWKYYNLTNGSGVPYSLDSPYDYELTQAEYEAGYANRALILGKPTSSGGVWVTDNAWNPVEP